MVRASTRQVVLAGLFVALGLIMPFLTRRFPLWGRAFCPCIFLFCWRAWVIAARWAFWWA